MRLRLALSLLGAALFAAGCGGGATSSEGADLASGKELFTSKCGGCHTMADAGTQGQIGPNLDDAFGYAREHGFDQSTFFEVTLEQMRIPAPPMPDYDEPGEHRLSQEQLVAVAAYVARCAGAGMGASDPPAECGGPAPAGGGEEAAGGTPEEQGKSLFASSGCGNCHVLADAGSSGAVGPNLDEAKPSLEEAARQIANGGNGMPAYEGQLSEEQIQALAKYLVSVVGK